MLDRQLYDFNRIIFDGKNFFSSEIGIFALENKLHFTNNYKDADKIFIEEIEKVFNLERKNIKIPHKYDQYCYYDDKISKKLNRVMDIQK